MIRILLFLALLFPVVAFGQPTSGGTVNAKQSGTWTVQPGNTANTTAWKVDGSSVTQPVSGTVTCNAGSNLNTSALATSANQTTVIGHVDGIEAFLSTLAGAVSGSEIQVDVLTLPADATELPAAATLGDNTSNPSTTSVGSYIFWYDGSTWDRARGDSTDGLLVNLGLNNDVTVTGSVTANAGTNLNTSALALESGGNLAGAATSLGVLDDWDESDRAKVNPIVGQAGVAGNSGNVSATTQRVVLATDVALPAGTNAIGKLAANSGVDIGDVDVASIAAGNNNIGDVDVASIAAGTNAIGGVYLRPETSNGTSTFYSIDLDETEEEIKGSAGQVYGWYLFNAASSTRYFRFYNATAANVTVGSTTNLFPIPVPAGQAANVSWPQGITFSTAITAACTTGAADNDTGAPSANECFAIIYYK